MKCSLTGQNTRVLAKAIHSFSRIGSELYLEANPNGLILRTVNDPQTAFAVMSFQTGFFTDFRISRSNSDEYCNKCKISMKSCLGVFKNLRQVEKCQITLNSNTSKLLFQFNCLFDTFKTHNVSILEQETLNAVYMTDNAPNRMTAPNKLFTEIIGNFRMYDNEITIEAATDSVVLKNHVDTHTDKHLMRTKLALKPQEFQEYHITDPTTITFCLKELRAILNFADALSLDMTVNFESAGKAVVFAFGSQDTFTANFVMSTLAPDDVSDCNRTNLDTTKQPNQNNTTLGRINISQTVSRIPIKVNDFNGDNEEDDLKELNVKTIKKPCQADENNMTVIRLNINQTVLTKPTEVIDLDDDDDMDVQVSNPKTVKKPSMVNQNNTTLSRSNINQTVSTKPNEVIDLDDDDEVSVTTDTLVFNPMARNLHEKSICHTRLRSPMRQLASTPNVLQNRAPLAKDTESEEICVIFRDESDIGVENCDEEMEIPASPQPDRRRRLKRVFPRCFQDTQYAENLSGKILAEMTDDEI